MMRGFLVSRLVPRIILALETIAPGRCQSVQWNFRLLPLFLFPSSYFACIRSHSLLLTRKTTGLMVKGDF